MNDQDALAAYDALARIFIEKVESGRAHSVKTYAEFKRLLNRQDKPKENNN